MEMPNVSPNSVTLPVFGGIQVNETLITSWLVTIGIIIFALIVRYVFFPRFKPVPKGFQNVMEMLVGMVENFTKGIMGERGSYISAYMFSLAFFLITSGLLELFGVRAPATDLNFTVSIALISFVLIAAFGIRFKGVKGWAKSYGEPVSFVAPFRIISDCVLPVSLSCRMFGNLFSGLVIMDMIYSAMGSFAIAIPAFASLFFNFFHVGMQTYVFMMLTLSFVQEKVE